MIQEIINFTVFCGENKVVLGIASIAGIVGFILTIYVSIRTAKIAKILKYNQVTSQYNSERLAFQKAFEGHRKSITEDNIRSNKLLKDILQYVESYKVKFDEILSLKEKIMLFQFIKILKKESRKVDYNKVCNYLAALSGRLSKKEEVKNG